MKNLDSIVNDLIRESFASGDRNNTTSNKRGMADKGGTARQMLSGEWFGSVAWPFDQSVSKDFEGSSELQTTQAELGQGERVATSVANEETGRAIVDTLLEDSPSYLYSDPSTVGYLLSSLREASLEEAASVVETVCENPSNENIKTLIKVTEELNNSDADPYFIESLLCLVETLVEKEEEESTEDDAVDDGSQKEDSETPTNEN